MCMTSFSAELLKKSRPVIWPERAATGGLSQRVRKSGRDTPELDACILPMMSDVFLHNPRCSKSRAALELVQTAGIELPVREYLKEPLSVDELRRIVEMLGVRPIEIARRGEPQYAALGLSDATSDDEVLRAMAEHPILIERPIVVRGGRAVVGRPPESVREIL
jgi:arsenate reductase (glutaredoxin)